MKTYNFSVYKDRIKPLSPTKGVSGNTNFYECTFEFDSDWGSLAKNAVFVRESSFIAPIVENKCIVHADVLKESGETYIGVFGFTETTEGKQLQISTNLIPFEVDEGAYREGIEASNIPPLDVWQVYQLACNQALQGAQSARDEAKEYASKAEQAKIGAEDAKINAETAQTNAEKARDSASTYSSKAEQAKIAADSAASRADTSAGNADYAMQEARNAKEQAFTSANAAETHKNTAGNYALTAKSAAESATSSAKQAMEAKDNAEASVNRILQEGESFVRNYGEQYISGQKTFVEKIILTEIGSYNAKLPIRASKIELEGYDGMSLKSTNGYPLVFQVGNKTYTLYDNGEFSADKIYTKEITSGDDTGEVKLNGKPIATKEYVDSKAIGDTLENIKKISGNTETELVIDGSEIVISPRGSVTISSVTGSIDFAPQRGNVTAYGKPIATREYVDEALKDVEGGSITIDDVPTEGSVNAVSSGGVYTAIKNKAEKSYVDSSIQQAILDSWSEVIEP